MDGKGSNGTLMHGKEWSGPGNNDISAQVIGKGGLPESGEAHSILPELCGRPHLCDDLFAVTT